MTRILFGATILLSVLLVKWSVAGVPIRSITAVLLIVVVAATRFDVIAASLHEAKVLIAIIAVCALLGTATSLLNATDIGLVGRQLLEIHAQAIVGTIIGVAVRRTCGPGTIVRCFGIAVGISAAVAVFQFLNVGAAWDARQALGSLQDEEVVTQWMYLLRQRAMGLSYSPVHLGTQLCLLFAALFAYRAWSAGAGWSSKIDPLMLLAVPLMAAAAIVSGNRSPLLGMLVFTLLYLWLVRRRHAFALIAIGIALYPVIQILPESPQSLGLRVASTDDGSAVGRTVLQVYGLMLLTARPFGYGFAFDSTEHWVGFWSYLRGFANAEAITSHALHNYYLMMANKYGILILVLAAIVVRRLADQGRLLLGFVSYMVHIFYHNDGPLQADFLIWYIVPMYAGLAGALPRRPPTSASRVWPVGAYPSTGVTPPAHRLSGREAG